MGDPPGEICAWLADWDAQVWTPCLFVLRYNWPFERDRKVYIDEGYLRVSGRSEHPTRGNIDRSRIGSICLVPFTNQLTPKPQYNGFLSPVHC